MDEEDEQRNDDEDEAVHEEEKDCSDIKRHRRSTCKLRLNIPCPGRRENVVAIVERLIGRLIPSSRMYRGESAGYRSCAPYAIDGRYYHCTLYTVKGRRVRGNVTVVLPAHASDNVKSTRSLGSFFCPRVSS